MRRLLFLAAAALLLGGCASWNNVQNDVSTFGPWPADRVPGSYGFERLPSQQAQPERPQMLEDAARGALEAAGFRAMADPNDAEYLVQLGARVSSNSPWIYNDPLFWRVGWGYGFGQAYPYRYGYGRRGFGPYWGPYWGSYWGPYGMYGFDVSSFERDVALLIRDRKTGQLLYEARASNVGPSTAIDYLLPAMFEAALKDFPAAGPNPRSVVVPISAK